MGGLRVTRMTRVTRMASGDVCLLLVLLLAGPSSAVKGPPVLTQRVSPHLVVRLGDDVRLSCPVAATPPPMLEWKKDGTQILDTWERFNLQENMLRVSRVTADDAGVYVCVAVNGFGTMRVATELFVIDPKSSPQWDGRGSGGGRDTADNLVTSLGRPPVILLQRPSGEAVRGPAGTRLRLACTTAGYPEPQVKWYKSGQAVLESARLQIHGPALVFSRLLPSDDGVYICVASNVFGSANHSFTLQTTEPLSPDPVFLAAPANTTVYEGDMAVLQCRIQSISKAHIKWVRKLGPSSTHSFNQTVNIGGGQYAVLSGGSHTVQDGDRYLTKLTLPSVRPSHEGVYVCYAANENGYSGREAFLHVAPEPLSPDPVFLAAPANTTVYEGDMAVLQCRIQSISKAHIKWVRKLGPSSTHSFNQTVNIGGGQYAVLSGGSHTVQDGDRYLTKLTLPSVRPSHEGVYVCYAANENGYSGREAFLHVAPAPSDSMQALLIALPVVALVGFLLGAVCCLQRRRKTLPPPSDAKHKHYSASLPPGGARPHYVTQRYDKDGERSVRTVLMPPTPLAGTDDGSLSSRAPSAPPPPPPAPYDYRHFRHLDVV